ncbi:hypothetical protein ACO0LL_01855 [Undibacterium sp. TC4M20W]|uniref:hypothetical protein n=1 Tax=Undibacterium sp. TC4M20W TaxID=3413052 RepID=UPI003BF00EDD
MVEEKPLLEVPGKVVEAIKAQYKEMPVDYNEKPCRFIGKKIALRAVKDKLEDWAVTTADACSWAAASAPVWVLVKDDTNQYKLVLYAPIYDMTVGSGSQNGFHHIATARATAGWSEQLLWKFDGKVYKLAKKLTQ